MEVKTGLKAKTEITVGQRETANYLGSGSLDVYASPAMITLMEKTAMMCIESQLEKGQNTVGVEIDVKHIRATVVGQKVYCTAELIETDRSKLTFKVEAFDSKGMIGYGTHKRFLIVEKDFIAKITAKNN